MQRRNHHHCLAAISTQPFPIDIPCPLPSFLLRLSHLNVFSHGHCFSTDVYLTLLKSSTSSSNPNVAHVDIRPVQYSRKCFCISFSLEQIKHQVLCSYCGRSEKYWVCSSDPRSSGALHEYAADLLPGIRDWASGLCCVTLCRRREDSIGERYHQHMAAWMNSIPMQHSASPNHATDRESQERLKSRAIDLIRNLSTQEVQAVPTCLSVPRPLVSLFQSLTAPKQFNQTTMARKPKGKPSQTTPTTLMFPSLHSEVANAVSSSIQSTHFHQHDDDYSSNNTYSTNVMGKFRCPNVTCQTYGWSSKVVTILIRGYPGNGYNAVVFKQRCRACNRLGILTLDERSYVERVTYRLKKWAGVHVERPEYSEKDSPPHETSLCEGCKRGICRRGFVDWV